ncbi:MAG: hypothetical protein H7319_09160, partial [Spirosoma sp.]|nr:hypothetical protein [Spirosoma sp.]
LTTQGAGVTALLAGIVLVTAIIPWRAATKLTLVDKPVESAELPTR